MQTKSILQRTAKKIFKAGYFQAIQLGQDSLTFRHFERKFCFQFAPQISDIGGLFRSGYSYDFEVLAPTFESEYQTMKMQKRTNFYADFQHLTDNPDFVLRNALNLINPQAN